MGRAAQLDHPHPIRDSGPTPDNPRGPSGDAIESFANGFAGKGKQINATPRQPVAKR